MKKVIGETITNVHKDTNGDVIISLTNDKELHVVGRYYESDDEYTLTAISVQIKREDMEAL
ncbi:hypothetical protein [Alkalicoccobacillus gibsonii]|uniref:hypothetical protein n=1 Tax=Alkalicoccobacillus gibsonii TaxID=79881 RepID=UPI0035164B68